MARKKSSLSIIVLKLEHFIGKLTGYLLIILGVVLAVSLARNVRRVRTGDLQVASLESDVQELRLEQENLQEKLSKVRSDEFVEKQLRDSLGLAREGEIVVVLPDEEVVKKFSPMLEEKEEVLPDPNWKKWAKIFGLMN